jgi:hypothetical protein
MKAGCGECGAIDEGVWRRGTADVEADEGAIDRD